MSDLQYQDSPSTDQQVSNTPGSVEYGRHSIEHPLFNPLPGATWPLVITMVGALHWHPGDFWYRERCFRFFIEQVTKGEIDFEQNGRQYRVGPGQVFLHHPGSCHTYRTHGQERVVKYYFMIEGFMLEYFLKLSGIWSLDAITLTDPARFDALRKSAFDLLAKRPKGFDVKISTLTYNILLTLSRDMGSSHPPVVQAALDFIRTNLDKTIMVDAIARHAGVSKTALWSIFKKSMGTTPVQLHSNERMAFAETYIRHTRLSLKEIAYKIGFDDPYYFSKVFKKCYGKAPSKLRGKILKTK